MKNKAFRYLLFILFIPVTFISVSIKAQSSLYMPAATNWVSVGDLSVGGDQLTVEALIYYTGASVDIVSKHTDPSNVNYLLRIGSFEITTTSGFAAFGGVAAAGVSIVPNRMYHVAATYDGASLKYYVNGCLTGQMPWTGNMVTNGLITAIGNMSSCQCEQFVGYIDEVRIWNVARTQAEISANMTNLPTPTTQPGLLGYWKFDGDYINQQGNPVFDGVPIGAPQFQQVPLPYPTSLHESVTSSNPVCTGDAGGVINVSASGYYTPYEYSLDGITYGASPVFTNLPAGNYTVYTRPQNNNNCAVSTSVPITITDPAVLNTNLTTTNVTCNGASNGSANVAPSGGDGANYHQVWQPSLNTTTGISGLAPGNYSVTVTDTCKASGQELVTNGQFEDGNTGFSTGYVCCSGGPGNYAVDANPTYYNGGHFGSGFGGAGNYLIADGSTVPGTSLWCQSITVTPNTYYTLSAMVASNYTIALAVLDFTINGTSVGTVNAPATTFTWDPFQTVWFSGASTSANICIINQNTVAGGNDFGVDNISFKSCTSCTATSPFTITEPPPLTVGTSQTDVSCNGGSNGTATATAGGGAPGYNYSWNTTPVQNTATATSLSAGTYTVTVTDASLCTATASVTIIESGALSASVTSQTNVTCNGGNNGAATASPIGGSPAYSYSWNTTPVQTGITASNLSAGTYTVTVTDQNSCSTTASVTITEPAALSVSVNTQTNVSCNSGTDGTATASASGGTGAYSFAWNSTPPQLSAAASNLSAGTYTVAVADINSCTATNTVTITEPAALTLTTSQTDVSCSGGTDGTATVTANGGAAGYTYSWSTTPVQNTVTATNLSSGTYTVTVSDMNLCSATTSVTIIQSGAFSVSISSQTNVLCNGGNNGSATALPAGGTPGYTYSWNTTPVQTGITASNLPAGIYTVTVSDANSCGTTASVTITEPTALTASITSQSNVLCNGGTTGNATVSGNGGTINYSYSWNTTPVQNSATANNLAAGSYTVTVTDQNSCTNTASATITEPAAVSVSVNTQTNVSCNSGTNGSATATGNGGTGAYSFAWNTTPPQLGATATNLSAGTYTVVVADLNSCTATNTVTITEPSALSVAITSQINVNCNGDNTGSSTALANGGTATYSYSWNTSPVQNAASATNLTAGTYTVTVTDFNSCSATNTVTINEPPLLVLSLNAKTNPTCNGLTNGSISLNTSGGQGAYSYVWTPNVSTTNSAANLGAGSYDVTVTDDNLCTQTLNIILTEPDPLTVNASNNTSICRGLTGNLSATAVGGTGSYAYSWSNGPVTSSQTVQPATTTNYTVTVTDIQSCTATDSVLITVFQPAVIDLGNDTSICQGDVLTLNAGPGFSSYLWQNSSTAQTLNAGFPDMYFVTGVDGNGCIVKDTIIVTVNPLPVIGLQDTLRICPATSANLNANPGYVSYTWNTGELTSSITVNSPGLEKVIVQDVNGCINTDSTFVFFHPIPQLSFTNGPLTGCEPLSVSTLNTTVLNGSSIAAWDWTLGPETSNDTAPTLVLMNDGIYNLTVQTITDSGCVVDSVILNYVTVNPKPIPLIVPEAMEYEMHDDFINISNQSMQADSYIWSLWDFPISTDVDMIYPIADSGHFDFELLAMNSYGCKDSTSIIITVNPSYAIFFPNAFTPNGNGNNETYKPIGYGINTFEMMIFDRWGEMVFKSTDINTGWDGTYKGNLPFRDVYVYKCKIRDIKGDPHYFFGHITLVQ